MSSPWFNLAAPFNANDSRQLISLNGIELITITCDPLSSCLIQKYNMIDNAWYKWRKCWGGLSVRIVCYDKNNQLLYLYGSFSGLFSFDCQNDKYTGFHQGFILTASKVISFIIDNTIHIIGGQLNNQHFKYDSIKNKFILHYEFPLVDRCKFDTSGLIKISSKDMLLLIGRKGSVDMIYSYSLLHDVWTKLDIKLPISGLMGIGCAITRDEQYLILLGGATHDRAYDIVNVMDISNMKVYGNGIRCPKEDFYETVIVSDIYKEELTVFGYIRCIQNVPNEIVRIIQSFYIVEYLYLMPTIADEFWKINVDAIINEIKWSM